MTRQSPHVCFVRLRVLELAAGYIIVSQNGWMGGEVLKMPREASYRYDAPLEIGKTYSFMTGKWLADRQGWAWTETYE